MAKASIALSKNFGVLTRRERFSSCTCSNFYCGLSIEHTSTDKALLVMERNSQAMNQEEYIQEGVGVMYPASSADSSVNDWSKDQQMAPETMQCMDIGGSYHRSGFISDKNKADCLEIFKQRKSSH